MYSSDQIRSKFLEFFETKDHAIVPSAPLVPENDSSVLFNTAGMQPMVPYLMGEKHPKGTRIADSQKCVRTVDLEEVGDDSHCTFFEMLGNWSLGDYFKEESITWSYEFLTSSDWLGLDPKYLAVTVFEGDDQCPADDESAEIWEKVGIPKERISYLPASENWWALGPTGPCGPDTEIFYWVGEGEPPAESNVANDEDNWMEIWNNVFMVYNRDENGKLHELPNKNVDTGMGMERALAILNGKKNVYETDLLENAMTTIHDLVGANYDERSARIVADHLRASVHLIADGVRPKNVDQGYILRRLIRRAIREMYKMKYEQPFTRDIAILFIDLYKNAYPKIGILQEDILEALEAEETSFVQTLKKGLREFEKIREKMDSGAELSGEDAFRLYDTFGFPIEMTRELADEHALTVNEKAYNVKFSEHQEKSRTAAAGKFKGGLADNDPQTLKLHTATHILLAGLRKFLGDHVHQAGSNITPERLRFDFTHPEKVERDMLDQIEIWANEIISSPCSMDYEIMPKQQAKDQGVEGSFWEKYPDEVKVYTLKGADGAIYSQELCGGPHVETTEGMGKFKIKKEESSSRGVRRIKAILTEE